MKDAIKNGRVLFHDKYWGAISADAKEVRVYLIALFALCLFLNGCSPGRVGVSVSGSCPAHYCGRFYAAPLGLGYQRTGLCCPAAAHVARTLNF
jgi:hypothetical protein